MRLSNSFTHEPLWVVTHTAWGSYGNSFISKVIWLIGAHCEEIIRQLVIACKCSRCLLIGRFSYSTKSLLTFFLLLKGDQRTLPHFPDKLLNSCRILSVKWIQQNLECANLVNIKYNIFINRPWSSRKFANILRNVCLQCTNIFYLHLKCALQ